MNMNFKIKDENSKNILFNIIGAFFVKGGAMIVSLFTVPAYMHYFNDESMLGVWFTIVAIFQSVLSFDLGIGNGLRNRLIEVLAKKDWDGVKSYISSAYWILGVVSVTIGIFIEYLVGFFNWNSIFNITSDIIGNEYLVFCVRIIVAGLIFQFILNIISSILYALQKSAIVNFMTLVSNTLILIFVKCVQVTDVKNGLLILSIVNAIALNLPLLICSFVIFQGILKKGKPSVKKYNSEYAKNIFNLGMKFFWLQVMIIFVAFINEFLISKLSGPNYTVEYQVYYKLFNTGSTIFSLALTPIWSAVSKAQMECNYSWIKKLHKILMSLGISAIIVELAIIPFLQVIMNVWLGNGTISVNSHVAIVCAINNALLIWHNVNCNVANGLGYLKPQIFLLTFAAIVKIPFSIVLVDAMDNWTGVLMASILALLPLSIVQPIYIQKKLKELVRG